MITNLITMFADTSGCKEPFLLGFHTWYHYLPRSTDANGVCSPRLSSLSDIWLIAAAIIEILLRLAAIVAVGYVIYGGLTYVTSQGEPDKTQKAKMTLINAMGGLIVAVMATAIVTFVAGRVH